MKLGQTGEELTHSVTMAVGKKPSVALPTHQSGYILAI